jgi:hypothetical protein
MRKSAAEIDLIRAGAAVADVGGYAIRDAVPAGAREIDVAMAGRDAMELEIARRFPEAEYRDTWVWFQSGLNTDGAHNPVTGRVLERGDILSLNTFPMISGYYTALERTMFVAEVDAASARSGRPMSPRMNWASRCSGRASAAPRSPRRSTPSSPSATCCNTAPSATAIPSACSVHYYGREAGLELREDIDTVLEPGMVISMEPMLTIPRASPAPAATASTTSWSSPRTGQREHHRLSLRPGLQRGGGMRVEFITIYPNVLNAWPVAGPDTQITNWFRIIFLSVFALVFGALWIRWRRFREARIDPMLDAIGDWFAETFAAIGNGWRRFRNWLAGSG